MSITLKQDFAIADEKSLAASSSVLMSGSSFKGSPTWALTLISIVVAPASNLFCSFIMMSLRTSPSGDLERFTFAPQSIH